MKLVNFLILLGFFKRVKPVFPNQVLGGGGNTCTLWLWSRSSSIVRVDRDRLCTCWNWDFPKTPFVVYFHWKILARAGIWTRDLPGTKRICYQLSYPGWPIWRVSINFFWCSSTTKRLVTTEFSKRLGNCCSLTFQWKTTRAFLFTALMVCHEK